MNCEEFSQKVSDYVEDRLPYGERLGMWLHGILCPACKHYQEQVEWIIDLAGDTKGDEEAEPPCPDSVKSDLVTDYREKYCGTPDEPSSSEDPS